MYRVGKDAKKIAQFSSAQFGKTAGSLGKQSFIFAKQETSLFTKTPTYTKNNYRQGLIKKTGIDPGKEMDAHHVMTQSREKFFEGKGFNIDEPQYLTWWDRRSHRSAARAYNDEWALFIQDHQNATSLEILEKGRQMMTNLGMDVNY